MRTSRVQARSVAAHARLVDLAEADVWWHELARLEADAREARARRALVAYRAGAGLWELAETLSVSRQRCHRLLIAAGLEPGGRRPGADG